jgi:hypothetical protein
MGLGNAYRSLMDKAWWSSVETQWNFQFNVKRASKLKYLLLRCHFRTKPLVTKPYSFVTVWRGLSLEALAKDMLLCFMAKLRGPLYHNYNEHVCLYSMWRDNHAVFGLVRMDAQSPKSRHGDKVPTFEPWETIKLWVYIHLSQILIILCKNITGTCVAIS